MWPREKWTFGTFWQDLLDIEGFVGLYSTKHCAKVSKFVSSEKTPGKISVELQTSNFLMYLNNILQALFGINISISSQSLMKWSINKFLVRKLFLHLITLLVFKSLFRSWVNVLFSCFKSIILTLDQTNSLKTLSPVYSTHLWYYALGNWTIIFSFY